MPPLVTSDSSGKLFAPWSGLPTWPTTIHLSLSPRRVRFASVPAELCSASLPSGLPCPWPRTPCRRRMLPRRIRHTDHHQRCQTRQQPHLRNPELPGSVNRNPTPSSCSARNGHRSIRRASAMLTPLPGAPQLCSLPGPNIELVKGWAGSSETDPGPQPPPETALCRHDHRHVGYLVLQTDRAFCRRRLRGQRTRLQGLDMG